MKVQLPRKADVLLVVRGILALSVVVWHVEGYKGEYLSVANIPGRTAVWIFFGLSGYVMGYGFFSGRYNFNSNDLRDFYTNRFLRIFPLFWLVSIAGFIGLWLQTNSVPISWADVPSQFFMTQFNHHYIFNGSFWTLGIEVQFYVIAPLVAYFLSRKFRYNNILFVAVYAGLLILPLACFVLFKWSLDGRNLLSTLSHFFIGMLTCKLILNKSLTITIKPYILAIALISVVMTTNFIYHFSEKLYWTAGSFLVDVAIILAIVLHTCTESSLSLGSNKLLRVGMFLGLISYGVYAWHSVLLENFVILEQNVVLAVGATILVAYIAYVFIEQPALRLKKKKGSVKK